MPRGKAHSCCMISDMFDDFNPLSEGADLIAEAERLLQEAKELQERADSIGREINNPIAGKIH